MIAAVDTFAGPGGWDVVCAWLGIDVTGIEWDKHACATRKAAGHATVQADVSELNPLHYPAELQIGSPPCQGFTLAGNGRGRADSLVLLARLERVTTLGDLLEAMDELRPLMTDDKTLLVLEPLRWALTTLPDYIAWEQVMAVLPIWSAAARILRAHGYSVATGVLKAEMFGVPQTRKRALLVARSAKATERLGPAALPVPTHSRYYSHDPKKLDPGMPKWVSMDEALGWSPDLAAVSNYGTGGDPAARGVRRANQPAATVTSKASRVKVVATGQNSRQGGGRTKKYERVVSSPAPTITGQARSWRLGESHREANQALTLAEAACLQTFPVAYPWQGGRVEQFQQVGNAVPPVLAHAVLGSLLGAV